MHIESESPGVRSCFETNLEMRRRHTFLSVRGVPYRRSIDWRCAFTTAKPLFLDSSSSSSSQLHTSTVSRTADRRMAVIAVSPWSEEQACYGEYRFMYSNCCSSTECLGGIKPSLNLK